MKDPGGRVACLAMDHRHQLSVSSQGAGAGPAGHALRTRAG